MSTTRLSGLFAACASLRGACAVLALRRRSVVLMLMPTSERCSIALVLFFAACGGDGGGGSPPSGTGTIAYIETSCRQDGPDMTLQQDVRILHGDAPSVTAMSVGPLGPFTSLLCATYGSNRYSMRDIGPVKRFGITPDGSGVAFEVTDVFIRDPG